MKHLLDVLKGAIFGISNIVPGVSGGTMAVVMHVFDDLIEIFSLNLQTIKKKWKFVLFFGLGAVLGLAAAAFALKELFEVFFVPTQMFFTGVIVGSIPFIFKLTVKDEKLRPMNTIPFVLGIGLLIFLSVYRGGGNIPVNTPVDLKLMAIMALFLFIAAIAMIIPGISGSMILMILGGYQLALNAVTELDLKIIAAMCIGAGLGLVFGSKLINFLLKKFNQPTYCAILGLIIGSIYTIFPWQQFTLNAQGIAGIVLLIVGMLVPALMERLGSKNKKETE